MTTPTEEIMRDMFTTGIGIARFTDEIHHIPLMDFFDFPGPGERRFEPARVSFEKYDDGGGSAIAEIRFGRCPFAKIREAKGDG